MPGTRKLGRPTDHRRAMLRAMVTYLLENGRIETTITRAKEVRSMAEKMITLAKEDSLANKRAAMAYITKEAVVKNCLMKLPPNIRRLAAVTAVSSKPVPAAAMLRKCASSNWCNCNRNQKNDLCRGAGVVLAFLRRWQLGLTFVFLALAGIDDCFEKWYTIHRKTRAGAHFFL